MEFKIYKPQGFKTKKKQWSFRLEKDEKNGSVDLRAVDDETGEVIATLVAFFSPGDAVAVSGVRSLLEEYEHEFMFDSDGAIIIK